jgi:hypothetical protein
MPVDNREDEEDAVLDPAPVSPANVGTPSPGPEAVDEFPPDLEPQPVTDEAPSPDGERAEEVPSKPLPTFDERFQRPFEGLAYLGKLTKTFHYLGHDFLIRTITVDEVLEVGLLAKPYVGSLAETKAYQAALVAACVVSVDGQEPPIPITTTASDTLLANRFRWVNRNWFPPVLDMVYSQYLLLEQTVGKVMEALGEASG